jgi:dipeptidyl aminopeptidase/acylaminoacyl peptidase
MKVGSSARGGQITCPAPGAHLSFVGAWDNVRGSQGDAIMSLRKCVWSLLGTSIALFGASAGARAQDEAFSMAQALDYPFESELVAAERAPVIAWVRNLAGARNVWTAAAPGFPPIPVTRFSKDDGQELTQPTFSPDGRWLVFVRGGDHDANWPAAGNLPPNPDSSTTAPDVAIWVAAIPGGQAARLTEGDAPAISAKGVLAYLKDGQVWTASLDGKGKPARLFFDRGRDSQLTWSPDGSALAFSSDRGDHGFIGVYRGKDSPITWLAPSTNRDLSPRWSPSGQRVAFVRLQGDGGPPEPWLSESPHPWSIWTADVSTGEGRRAWKSPTSAEGSFPDVAGGANLLWGEGDRLVFLAEVDGWEHLYRVSAEGGAPILLTPGAFMVEDVALSADRRSVIYSANTGAAVDDSERRHLFSVSLGGSTPTQVTNGETSEWRVAPVSDGHIVFVEASPQRAPGIALTSADGSGRRTLNDGGAPSDFPGATFVTPRPVVFKAADGLTVHGQVFERNADRTNKPGVIFVHGGPPRQMLLGWHYMDYYSNAYAVNQYLAAHGFAVLSVNYRLGIGYGRAFQHPARAGPQGASEYQDILAGARFLQTTPGIDGSRIGIWGGSYGGYLTGLALARNSDVFKAGVDLHGVHDWSRDISREAPAPYLRHEQGDRAQAMATAFAASPDAAVATWRSPVLLIQGDDDRNVDFQQTVDLARRLETQGVAYEELVIPDEIHGFLRHASWLKADTAAAAFLERELKRPKNGRLDPSDSGISSTSP